MARCSAALIALLLAGCGHASGSFLPPLKHYDAAFQTQLRKEQPVVRQCCPNTNQFVKDSIQLRDKIRAGEGVQQKQTGGLSFGKIFGK